MENRLKKIYSQARRDIGREWYKYMESIKPEADRLLKAYEDAKLTDDKDLIKKTGKEYGQFLRQQTYMSERYKLMLDTTTTKLANVNEIALSYLNDEMPKIYVTNYNQLSKDMPAGISFSLVDETTVKNLIKDNPKLLPTKELDIPKDKRWNQKAINAQVLQSIIQGESIPEMAKRLTPIMDRNKKSAIRNARTMTTSAQNKGRLDSYRAGQDKGVVLRKVWMATNSERTRAWHAALNGVEADIDEPFENDYGKIMFPGDPTADPGNVYNCRCTMRAHIIGFRREDGSIKYIEGEEPKNVESEEPTSATLKNYNATYKEFKEKRASQIKDMLPFDDMNKLLNDLVDNNEFRMRIPIDDATVLSSILRDGKFKTQFETGTSGGAFSPFVRKQASTNLFGTGDIPDSDYEKYGYLGSKDPLKDINPQLLFYGDGIVTFKKDAMMNRTTLTVGDSLRDAADGRFIMGTKATNIDSTVAVGRPSAINDYLDRMTEGIDKYGIEDASHIGYKVRSYIETQYHGDLMLADVDSMVIDKDILDEVTSNSELKKILKDSGIKCNYVINGELMRYEL